MDFPCNVEMSILTPLVADRIRQRGLLILSSADAMGFKSSSLFFQEFLLDKFHAPYLVLQWKGILVIDF